MILSGEFGLVKPNQLIPDYDPRLRSNGVAAHVETVAAQLAELEVRHVVFFARSEKTDENIGPYLKCINAACDKVGLPITTVEVENS